MFKILVLSALCFAITLANQYTPIQNTYDGITIGQPAASLHIEVFYDLLCPDSKAANELFNQLLAQTDVSNVKFTYHMFPLPYHMNSYFISQGVSYFQNKFNNEIAIKYINYVFENQHLYSDGINLKRSRAELTQQLADDLEAKVGDVFDKEAFVAALQPGNEYNIQLRYSWKYGCSRGITGTPIYLINGVVGDGAEGWSLEAWQQFIMSRSQNVRV